MKNLGTFIVISIPIGFEFCTILVIPAKAGIQSSPQNSNRIGINLLF